MRYLFIICRTEASLLAMKHYAFTAKIKWCFNLIEWIEDELRSFNLIEWCQGPVQTITSM